MAGLAFRLRLEIRELRAYLIFACTLQVPGMQFRTCQGNCFILQTKLEIGFRASITNEKGLGKLIEKRPFDPGLRTEISAHARPIGGCLMQHARARANLLHPTCICMKEATTPQ